MDKKFLNFHLHTIYSTRDGMLRIKDLIEFSKEHNECFAITDHGSVLGFVELANQCLAAGMKPIYGIEAYISKYRNRLLELNKLIEEEKENGKNKDLIKRYNAEKNTIKDYDHICILAKTPFGLQNLIELSNLAYINGFYRRPTLSYDELFNISKNKNGSSDLIITSACIGGTFGNLVLKEEFQAAKEHIQLMMEKFGEDFYLEIQFNDMDMQRSVNKYAVIMHKELGVKLCIGSDAHFLKKEDHTYHQDFLLLQSESLRSDLGIKDLKVTYENKKGETKSKKIPYGEEFKTGFLVDTLNIGDKVKDDTIIAIEEVDRAWISNSVHHRSESELRADGLKMHSEIPPEWFDEIFASNYEIYDKIETFDLDRQLKLPTVENSYKVLESKVMYNFEHYDELFPQENLMGISNKFKSKDKNYFDRLNDELTVIRENDFADYFLILTDIMEKCRTRGIAMGAGRGSGVSSLVGFLLGIHRINPLDSKWHVSGEIQDAMPFERFLSKTRNNKKVIITGDNGDKIEYLDTDKIIIERNKQLYKIQAIDLKPNDMIMMEE